MFEIECHLYRSLSETTCFLDALQQRKKKNSQTISEKKTLNLLDEQIRIENKHLKELNEINSNSAFFTSISVLPPDQNLSLSVARFGLRGNADFESMKYVVTEMNKSFENTLNSINK